MIQNLGVQRGFEDLSPAEQGRVIGSAWSGSGGLRKLVHRDLRRR